MVLPFQLVIRNLSKSYGGLPLWDGLELTLVSGRAYCLMGASGIGKTTLFRVLLGLEKHDEGTICYRPMPKGRLTAVFQEDRLCESFSPLENVSLVVGKAMGREEIARELSCLLPLESVARPVSTLSGGMRRRVAIARSLLAPSCGILMDEPFTGLDEETRRQVIGYVKRKIGGRLLVVATHQEEEVKELGGERILPFM